MPNLTIGQLAKATNVTRVAIRYYERCGLIPSAARLQSGYRSYPATTITRIHFIKNAQAVGFTLTEINELLTLQQHHTATSQNIRAHALGKLKTIQDKMSALQKISQTLMQLTASCDGTMPVQECPILAALQSKIAIP